MHTANKGRERPFRIGVMPVPGFALLSYACTVEPLRAANLLSGRPLYDVIHVANGPAAHSSGAALVPADIRVGADVPLDLLLVVAGGAPERFDDGRALAWLRRLARRGVALGGVSGGPVILARAGLLAGRRFTVHWEHVAALEEIAPGLALERSLYVVDRDRVTCGGGTAALDLMHALIALHHGAEVAQKVSDWFLHTEVRPSGGAQRAGLVARLGTTSAPVLEAVAAMTSHVADPLTLEQLALVAGVTPRQLGRLFRDKLGISPMAFYRRERLEIAAKLLRGSSLSVTEVALATGFGSPAHFSSAFAKAFGGPPRDSRG